MISPLSESRMARPPWRSVTISNTQSPSAGECGRHLGVERLELAPLDRVARARHHQLEMAEVVDGQEPRAQRVLSLHQVVQIPDSVGSADRAVAARIQRRVSQAVLL